MSSSQEDDKTEYQYGDGNNKHHDQGYGIHLCGRGKSQTVIHQVLADNRNDIFILGKIGKTARKKGRVAAVFCIGALADVGSTAHYDDAAAGFVAASIHLNRTDSQ